MKSMIIIGLPSRNFRVFGKNGKFWDAKPCWLFFLLLLAACQTAQVEDSTPLFTSLSSEQTGVDFQNTLTESDSFNIIQYLYFFNGGGVAAGDLNNDQLPDLFFTSNQSANQLYLNEGNLHFENISTTAGIATQVNWSTGVTMADVNSDGWMDIYVCEVGNYKGLNGRNKLYLNNGDAEQLSFTESATAYGLDHAGFSTQAAFFDYDLDGDLDCYLLCHSVHSPSTFRDTAQRNVRDEFAGDRLFRNDGETFIDVSASANIKGSRNGYGLGLAISDLNGDGCPDIYIGNDFHENDYLYFNNCDGTFTESFQQSLSHSSQFSMGNDIADINNDGLPDILSLDMKPESEPILKKSVGADAYDIFDFKQSYGYGIQFPRNALQLNQGNLQGKQAVFSDIAPLLGIEATDWSWSALIADLDNNSWPDIFIANGIVRRPNDLDYLRYSSSEKIQAAAADLDLARLMPSGAQANYAYRNNGELDFEKVSDKWGLDQVGSSTGAAYADLDRDGDLELIINNINQSASIFENTASDRKNHRYLQIALSSDSDNPFEYGAKVSLYSGGEIQQREVSPTRGFMSCSDPVLHFGLGAADTPIDSLRIDWSNRASELIVYGGGKDHLKTNDLLTFSRKGGNGRTGGIKKSSNLIFQASTKAPLFQHRENRYFDNNQEVLIPHFLSTQGPALAVGDVNGDGLEDVFVGGASGQSDVLFLQTSDGRFKRGGIADWEMAAPSESVAASFFDAEGDGDLDLYVATGGNEKQPDKTYLHDRFYWNDGQGNFTRALAAMPEFYGNTACVQAADYDGDGDQDIFVGGRSVGGVYGMSPKSYLLINNGQGQFAEMTSELAPKLANVGMVTDARWGDVNGDGQMDLTVVGEWMPLSIFYNRGGKLMEEKLPQTEGWWNCLELADLDNDGDLDMLAGNFGWNSHLRPSPEFPLYLYLKDFDQNMSFDPIITHFREGREYPLPTKDELTSQLVILKRVFTDYTRYAHATFDQVFPRDLLKGALRRKALTFSSSWIENQGNGQFLRHDLPQAAQVSTVNALMVTDVDGDGHQDIILGGNFYETMPSIGRFDAGKGLYLRGNGTREFSAVPARESGLVLDGVVRALASLQLGGEDAIIVGNNNAAVELWSISR